MGVLRIHTVPGDEAFLRQRAGEVTEFGEKLQAIARDMTETLPMAGGIGLAAPQVGHSIRLVLIDVSQVERKPEEPEMPPPFFLVNPVIVQAVGEAMMAEGCLSVPGVRVEIPRKSSLRVQARGLDGSHLELSCEGLPAIVVQHELDHLDGRLIVDWAAQGCRSYREGEEKSSSP